jgi:hypothetical protein
MVTGCRRLRRPPAGQERQSLVPELSLRALRAVEDQLVVGVQVGAPAVLVRRQPDLAALGALWDEGNLFGAQVRPTNAAMEVPTAWIGLAPDETSSRYTFRARRALFLAARTTRPTPATTHPVRLIGAATGGILKAPRRSRGRGSRRVGAGSPRPLEIPGRLTLGSPRQPDRLLRSSWPATGR